MSTLTIPDEHTNGLSRILALQPEEAASISRALTEAKSAKVKEMMDLIIGAVAAMEVKPAWQIAQTLSSLYAARNAMDLPVEVFIHDVINAARKQLDQGEPLPATAEATLRALLSVNPLSMMAKARELHIDHEHIFCNARVISDMRPVFDANIEEAPTGFTVAHTLKIGYHHGDKHTSIYIAMDKQDIESMIETLQRAQQKSATLAKLWKSKNLSILAD